MSQSASAARPAVSIGIIASHRRPELEAVIELVKGQPLATRSEILVALESADAAEPTELTRESNVRWLAIPKGRGFGYNRNVVLAQTRGETLVFVDDDCEPAADWLPELLAPLADSSVDAVVGRVVIPPSTFVGDAISGLGFPAGGSLGYEQMFTVHADGRTDNIATGNCALRRRVLEELGGFDEALVAGGEDTELAYRMTRAGKKILYHPAAVVVHPARSDLGDFCRWFFRRGRAKYHFARKVSAGVGGYVQRRLKSSLRVLWLNRGRPQIVLIAPLLLLSLLLQQAGFLWEALCGRSR